MRAGATGGRGSGGRRGLLLARSLPSPPSSCPALYPPPCPPCHPQLPGFKRILNYIKKVEAEEARRPWLSREEAELLDVTRQMEEEMVEEYKQVPAVHAVHAALCCACCACSACCIARPWPAPVPPCPPPARALSRDRPQPHAPRGQVERIIGERHWSDGTVKYLCK